MSCRCCRCCRGTFPPTSASRGGSRARSPAPPPASDCLPSSWYELARLRSEAATLSLLGPSRRRSMLSALSPISSASAFFPCRDSTVAMSPSTIATSWCSSPYILRYMSYASPYFSIASSYKPCALKLPATLPSVSATSEFSSPCKRRAMRSSSSISSRASLHLPCGPYTVLRFARAAATSMCGSSPCTRRKMRRASSSHFSASPSLSWSRNTQPSLCAASPAP
mmetsp:Transcript_27337/g.53288  ORF Transcript_27337/g.53288 Transcript_27337/m.53288 type:complete len:224 (+) Transcript_27337:610-1281(+)